MHGFGIVPRMENLAKFSTRNSGNRSQGRLRILSQCIGQFLNCRNNVDIKPFRSHVANTLRGEAETVTKIINRQRNRIIATLFTANKNTHTGPIVSNRRCTRLKTMPVIQ